MKKNQLISGAFFAAYTVLQMFLQKYVWENAAITSISISMLLESAAILAFAVIAVYLLCFETSGAKKRAIAMAGILYIIYVGLYFSVHQSLAMMGLIEYGQPDGKRHCHLCGDCREGTAGGCGRCIPFDG